MMKNILVAILLLNLFIVRTQAQITLEDLFQDFTFSEKGTPGFNFLKDGRHYTLNEGNAITEYDLVSGETTQTVFDTKDFVAVDRITFYQFSPDENLILIGTKPQKIYRHSYLADYFVYDRKTKTLEPVLEDKSIRDPLFSPDGKKLAFAYGNNLYYKELGSDKVVSVSKDGKEDEIINGTADWVYEEEFAITRLFDWSKDSKKLAYIRSDESKVPEFIMTRYNDDTYPEYEKFKYPKVGETNSSVSVKIFHLEKEKTTDAKIDNLDDNYLPRLQWTQDEGKLCVTWINRHQNHLKLLLVDDKKGKTETLLDEKNQYYIDINDNLTFLDNGKEFIWTSEKDGYNHIYLYDMSGKEKKQLTEGKWEVTEMYGIDQNKELVYYQAAKKTPLNREIYSVNLKGRKDHTLRGEDGWNSAVFSGNFDYYVGSFSTCNSPSVYKVFNRDDKEIRTIQDNSELVKRLIAENFQPIDFFTMRTVDGSDLNGYMILPAGFDKNKKYPLFMTQYGGPGSQQVVNRWTGGNMVWYQMLAQKGYVVACVDNRGTGARGEKFKKQTYLHLGEMETTDQIEAAKFLGKKSYIDENRIAIFGWSYGGYMSSNCILHGNDVFKAAIAIAPVTNWKWYDSIYTERYMQTLKENEAGYRAYSPIYFVDRLKGDYFIAHGLADDNVHFQNSAEMVRALVEAGKDFETMYYPNNHHGISGKGARMNLYKKMNSFLDRSLQPEK